MAADFELATFRLTPQPPFTPAQYNDYLREKEAELDRCPKGSYHVELKAPGLVHGSFSDYQLLAAQGRTGEATIALHNLSLTQSFTLAFLDKYLKRANEPLLDKRSRDPEAVVTRYGHCNR